MILCQSVSATVVRRQHHHHTCLMLLVGHSEDQYYRISVRSISVNIESFQPPLHHSFISLPYRCRPWHCRILVQSVGADVVPLEPHLLTSFVPPIGALQYRGFTILIHSIRVNF